MITPLDPTLVQSSSDDQNLKEIKRKASNEVQNINNGNTIDKEKKLREAAEGFEAIFIQQMWQSMRASLPKEGLMHSREEQFWQGMYDQELGKSMASAGGIGLADMMMSQLSKKLQNASEVTAETMQRTPLDIKPVPLMDTTTPKNIDKKQALSFTKDTDIYETEIEEKQKIYPHTNPNNISPTGPPIQNGSPINPINEALNEFSKQLNTPPLQPDVQLQNPQTSITNITHNTPTNPTSNTRPTPNITSEPKKIL